MPTIPDRLSAEELTRKVKGQRLTDGWDAVISFDLKKFNANLRPAWKTFTTKPLSLVVYEEALGANYGFDFSLGNPDTEFVIENGELYASLTIPLLDCEYWISTGATKDEWKEDAEAELYRVTSNQFALKCKVHQTDMKGTHWHCLDDGLIVPRNHEGFIVYNDFPLRRFDRKEANLNIIQLGRSARSEWTIKRIATDPSFDYGTRHFGSGAAEKLLSKLHEHAPGGLKIILPDKDDIAATKGTVRPSEFTFTATGGDDGGVLSIWVRIYNSLNGRGSRFPVSRTSSEEQICLLPKGSSVGIVFARQFYLSRIIYDEIQRQPPQASTGPIQIEDPAEGYNPEGCYRPDEGYRLAIPTPADGVRHRPLKSPVREQPVEIRDKFYHLRINPAGGFRLERSDEFTAKVMGWWSLNDVEYVLDFRRNYPNSFFLLKDGAVFGPKEMIEIKGDDLKVRRSDVKTSSQTPHDPDGEDNHPALYTFGNWRLNFVNIHLRPFANILLPSVGKDLFSFSSVQMIDDVHIWGAMSVPPSTGNTQVSLNLPVAKAPLQALTGVPMEKHPRQTYFDRLLTDEDFLFLFLYTAATTSASVLPAIAKSHRFPLPAVQIKDITRPLRISEDFDARLIAGTYQISGPKPFLGAKMFIDTLSQPPRVFLHDVPVSNVVINQEGCHLTFTLTPEFEHSAPFKAATTGRKGPKPATSRTVRATLSFALIFSFPLSSPDSPISFSGTVHYPGDAAESLPEELSVLTGFQVPAQDYLAVAMDSKAWGVVNWLSREYCLWGVIVWLCMNGDQIAEGGGWWEIPRGSAAWMRLRAFVDMWGEQEVVEVAGLVIAM